MDQVVKDHLAVLDKNDPEKKIGLMIDEWGPGTGRARRRPRHTAGADLVAGNVSFGKTFAEPLVILTLRLNGAGVDGAVRRGTGAITLAPCASGHPLPLLKMDAKLLSLVQVATHG